jgi:branched-chain amino acid transport system substrate-binding protein
VASADLKTDKGQKLLHRELARTDVLLTSFRPSALNKLGLEWKSLHKLFPQLSMVAIKATAPDAIFVPGYYTEAALICKQARDLGLTIPLFGGDGWEAPELISIGGAAVEGTYYSTHYSPESPSPAVKDFIKRFQARWSGETPDAMAALGYDSALVLVDAIRRAGTTEPAKLRDAIAATRNLEGVSGRTTIDAQRNASKPAVIVEVRNGSFRFVQAVEP